MRILFRGIGVPLPFVEIGETVFVWVLIENAGVFDGQTVFFEPLIWDRRMHLGVLQRGRQAVCADEMFFWNKKPEARAGSPLCRMLKLFCPVIEFDRDGGRRGSFCSRRLRANEPVAELDGAPPNADGGNEKEDRRRDEHDAIVMRLNPIQSL